VLAAQTWWHLQSGYSLPGPDLERLVLVKAALGGPAGFDNAGEWFIKGMLAPLTSR